MSLGFIYYIIYLYNINNKCTTPPSPDQCYIHLVKSTSPNRKAQESSCWKAFSDGANNDAKKYPGYLKGDSMTSMNNDTITSYIAFQKQKDYDYWQKEYHPRGPNVGPFPGQHGVLLKQLMKCMGNTPSSNSKTLVMDNVNMDNNWNGSWGDKCIKCPNR